MDRLTAPPAVYLPAPRPWRASCRMCIARFPDSAADIGRHVRGLLFVGYDPETLRIVHTQRIALCDDSDAVDLDAMWPDCAALVVVSRGQWAEVS